MAHDHPHGAETHDGEYADVDIKEALGLPDALPPIRLLPAGELAATARTALVPRQLADLAEWVGKDGREVDEEGDLTEAGVAEAVKALDVDADDLSTLWDYALAVEWLVFDEDDEDRVVPGDTADEWAAGDDESVLTAWASTFAAVVGETLERYGPEWDEDDPEDDEPEFDFVGQGMAIAILLFLARREGLSADEFAEVLWENAYGGHDEDDEDAHAEIAEARQEWESEYGDAARLLLDKLADTLAITEADDLIRLTPLALAALREQLLEAGVDIPLLPQTAAELSGTELLTMAAGVTDAEWEAETDAWTAVHGADVAARELLGLAADSEPGERMLAVAAVTRIGAAAEPAWRDALTVPQVRAYAKVALAARLVGTGGDIPAELPAELDMTPEDLAWVATDLLTLAIDEEFPDPEYLAVSFREAVPAGREPMFFDGIARAAHPDALDVLEHLGEYHPDRQIAKTARTAAHKAASRLG
jgi:hypothetical protein